MNFHLKDEMKILLLHESSLGMMDLSFMSFFLLNWLLYERFSCHFLAADLNNFAAVLIRAWII